MKLSILAILIFNIFSAFSQEGINEFEELAKGYSNQGKPTQAAEFYSKAGYAYWNKGKINNAAECFEKAYNLFLAANISNSAIAVCNNIGIIYSENNQFQKAYTAFDNALSLTRKTHNNVDIFNSLINLGTAALELSNFNEAIAKGNEATTIAKEQNNLKFLRKSYSLLAESYEKKGDANNAYSFFELYSSVDQKIKTNEMEEFKNMSAEEISKEKEKKRVTEIELKIKKGELKLTQDSLGVSERVAFQRKMQIELRNSQLQQKETQLRYERRTKRILISGIIVIALFLSVLTILLYQKLRDNKILQQQKEEITLQRNRLDLQNKKITDSIYYGLRIQNAMLPNINLMKSVFEMFLMYRPKDIVSGDFYWYYETTQNSKTYRFVAIVDCTGHGVPGAFMSMIGNRLLSEINRDKNNLSPSVILSEMSNHLKNDLNQDNRKNSDGMDVALCRISLLPDNNFEVTYAGAKRPLYYYSRELAKFEILEGTNKTIGSLNDSISFSETTVNLKKDDLILMFSDGIIDQPNDERDRFGTERLLRIATKNINSSMDEIHVAIETSFNNYLETQEQRDDITLIGLKLV